MDVLVPVTTEAFNAEIAVTAIPNDGKSDTTITRQLLETG